MNQIPFIQDYFQLSKSNCLEVRVKRQLAAQVISTKIYIVSEMLFNFKTKWRANYCM